MLGNRGDAAAIQRLGAQLRRSRQSLTCRVTGLKRLFGSLDVDYDRAMHDSPGDHARRARAVLTSTTCPFSWLRCVPSASGLIDIHSQHQTLLLGDSRFPDRVCSTAWRRMRSCWSNTAAFTTN
ncbi:MAG: hypothetical protein ACLTZY_10840 [Alistipes indistinctus]